jgi:ElaA protein
MITWQCKFFSELTNEEVYKILQLRMEVFIVEQNCVYQDCDNKDYKAYHFTAWEDDILLAYTRLLPIGISYPEHASIGRVITAPVARGKSMGKELMKRSIEQVYTLFGKVPIKISAQLYLKKFYGSFGFIPQGNVYPEDGIDHIAMEKTYPAHATEIQ